MKGGGWKTTMHVKEKSLLTSEKTKHEEGNVHHYEPEGLTLRANDMANLQIVL